MQLFFIQLLVVKFWTYGGTPNARSIYFLSSYWNYMPTSTQKLEKLNVLCFLVIWIHNNQFLSLLVYIFNYFLCFSRFLIFLMKRKMVPLNLTNLSMHSVSSIPMLPGKTKLIVSVQETIFCFIQLIAVHGSIQSLFLVEFLQLHSGCMIWDKLGLLSEKK